MKRHTLTEEEQQLLLEIQSLLKGRTFEQIKVVISRLCGLIDEQREDIADKLIFDPTSHLDNHV